MVELRIRKFGNSLGVVLPKEVLARLNVGGGQKLYLTEASEGGYRLVACDPALGEKTAKAGDIIRRYPNTLRALAK
ncbi:MAG TPA: AbrB/MazE/SpoVT family DNA-binding domain-containing protein [Reyranella sp.]|nr:AbrB/MazE/SpoVT family DNA-binding domain-containing protein [Reyranella sp.]